MDEFHDARRDAMVAGGLVALIAALLALWTSGILIAFGLVAVITGIVLSITVIGAIVGIPLVVVGVLGLVAGIVSGVGGVPFAILFGAGAGFVYYRLRMRALARAGRPPARRATY